MGKSGSRTVNNLAAMRFYREMCESTAGKATTADKRFCSFTKCRLHPLT
jgi:hypothetical protein